MKKTGIKVAVVSSIAALGVATIVASGLTLANWSNSADTAASTITAGTFGITAGAASWRDISTLDGSKTVITNQSSLTGGTLIPLGTFQVVPGDTIASTQPFDIDLQGENLKATVAVKVMTATGDLVAATQGVTIETVVFDTSGNKIGTTSGANIEVNIVSPDYQGVKPTGSIAVSGSATDVVVGFIAHFDSTTPAVIRQKVSATLAASSVSITQVQ